MKKGLTFCFSGREETCVKSAKQVTILGIAKGFKNISSEIRHSVRNLEGVGDDLDLIECEALQNMVIRLGLPPIYVARPSPRQQPKPTGSHSSFISSAPQQPMKVTHMRQKNIRNSIFNISFQNKISMISRSAINDNPHNPSLLPTDRRRPLCARSRAINSNRLTHGQAPTSAIASR